MLLDRLLQIISQPASSKQYHFPVMNCTTSRHSLVLCFAMVVALAGCDGLLTDTESGDTRLAVRFGTTSAGSSSNSQVAARQVGTSNAEDKLTLTGSNGTLVITDVRFIVEKLKLEREEETCEDTEAEEEREGCEEFEAAPFMVDLPLQGGVVDAARGVIPTGSYNKFEFEIKDLDLEDEGDEELDEEERALQALGDEIRAEFPGWPEEASMVATGQFTPEGGEPKPFTTFMKAEVEIELEFEEAVDLAQLAEKALTVQIDPEAWFTEADGSVLNLAGYDFEEDEELLEFEVKMKEGFTSVKIEREDREDEEKEQEDD